MTSHDGRTAVDVTHKAPEQGGRTVIDPPQHLLEPLSALSRQGRHHETIAAAEALLHNYPDSFLLWSLLGSFHSALGRNAEAEKCARNALALNPRSAAAHHNLGIILRGKGEMDSALAAFDQAIALEKNLHVAHYFRGTVLAAKGQLKEAASAHSAALEIAPNFAEAHAERGIALMLLSEFDAAIVSLRKAVEFNPRFAHAYNALGTILFEKKDLVAALEVFDRVLALTPGATPALPFKLHIHAQLCDFADTTGIEVGVDQVPPFPMLAWEDHPEKQLRRSESWWKLLAGNIRPLPMPARPRSAPARLRVGYLSSDYYDHATLYLMSGLFREHDKSKFEIFAYSYGTKTTGQLVDNLRKDVSVFRDVRSLSDLEIAKLVRSDKIDIAIDLKGYTTNGRSQLFRFRLAPIQINYLGYPGSLGADAIEYLVADQTLIPEESRRFYSESVIYLPHSYQPNDNQRRIAEVTTRRADFGLPDDAFVFCAFNRSHKLSSREFEIWMRILAKVPGSVLWLVRSNGWMEENLRKEAAARGIAPERLVIAEHLPHSEHLARHRHADLFIDTFNYNAHTTASDALWAGLPVVTKRGKQFAARVAASLLNAVGLSELITETEEQYKAKILELATAPDKLREIKAILAKNRDTHPLFDTKRYTRNFERGLQLAYDRYWSGEKPADIYVPDHESAADIV